MKHREEIHQSWDSKLSGRNMTFVVRGSEFDRLDEAIRFRDNKPLYAVKKGRGKK